MLLTAREAAERLGIKPDTLYAYVSRGLIRSWAVPGTRERRYRPEEIEGLRHRRGAAPGADAEGAGPVIASAICLIEDGRLYYRGEDAIRLAETATLEETASLLWGVSEGNAPAIAAPLLPRSRGRAGRGRAEEQDAGRPSGLVERCQMRLAALSSSDPAALDLTRAGVARTGRHILGELAACVAGAAPASGPAHLGLAAAWGIDAPAADLLRRALVLIADHELNASTYAARVVASTGATPYAVVAAALAALSGRRHGGAAARAEALFSEIARTGDPLAVMAGRLARDEGLPGFGQFLYPEGDPRAAAILAAIATAVPAKSALIEAAAAAGTRLSGQCPNVDFALAASATALGLPPGAALGLFILGRTVGWIAHAIEQYESGGLIRPRARYIGVRPASVD